MTTSINIGYIGVGKVHGRLAGSTGAFRFLGNVAQVTLKQDIDEQREQDFTRLGGGAANIVRRLKSVKADITLLSFIAANLALAVAGSVTAVTTGTVTDEVKKGYKGSLLRLDFPPSAVASVKNSAGSTTYVAGTDYDMSPGGLSIPTGSSITDAADLKITYTKAAHDRIEAAVNTATVLEMVVEGLNEVDGGAAVVTDMWRVSFPPASELALIGDKLGELKFTCELLADSTKGSGVSAFFRTQKT